MALANDHIDDLRVVVPYDAVERIEDQRPRLPLSSWPATGIATKLRQGTA
jgi:hypothetical protein